MKNFTVSVTGFVLAMSLAFQAFAAENSSLKWRMAKVHELKVRTASVSLLYALSFERKCGDVDVQSIKFTRGKDTVVGVAVGTDPTIRCDDVMPYKDQLEIAADRGDSSSVQALQ